MDNGCPGGLSERLLLLNVGCFTIITQVVKSRRNDSMYLRTDRNLVFCCIIVSIFSLVVIGCSKSKNTIDKPLPDGAFRAEISVENAPSTIKTGSNSKVRVKIKNIGNSVWPALGQAHEKFGINLGDHWLDKNGKIIAVDVDRAHLPYDIKPNQEAVLEINLKAPSTPGDYILEYDMVQEAVAWFKDKGSKTAQLNVKVE